MSITVPKRTRIPAQASAPPGEHRPAEPAERTSTAVSPPGRDRTAAVRDAVLAGGAVLSGVLVTTGFALDPARTVSDSAGIVSAVAAAPERFYLANLLGAVGLVMISCVGLATMRLAPGRGRGLATVGGLLLVLGGTAAAAGIFMYGAVVSVLADTQSAATATALQDVLGDSARTGLPFLVGFPAFLLGLLLCAAALLRARTVPWAVPALLLAGLVGIVALGDAAPALSTASDVVLALGCAAVGGLLWRRRSAPLSERTPSERTIVLPD